MTGIVFWAAAGALLSVQVWAWQLGMFVALRGLFQTAVIVIGVGNLQHALIATGCPLIMLSYMSRDTVSRYFNVDGYES